MASKKKTSGNLQNEVKNIFEKSLQNNNSVSETKSEPEKENGNMSGIDESRLKEALGEVDKIAADRNARKAKEAEEALSADDILSNLSMDDFGGMDDDGADAKFEFKEDDMEMGGSTANTENQDSNKEVEEDKEVTLTYEEKDEEDNTVTKSVTMMQSKVTKGIKDKVWVESKRANFPEYSDAECLALKAENKRKLDEARKRNEERNKENQKLAAKLEGTDLVKKTAPFNKYMANHSYYLGSILYEQPSAKFVKTRRAKKDPSTNLPYREDGITPYSRGEKAPVSKRANIVEYRIKQGTLGKAKGHIFLIPKKGAEVAASIPNMEMSQITAITSEMDPEMMIAVFKGDAETIAKFALYFGKESVPEHPDFFEKTTIKVKSGKSSKIEEIVEPCRIGLLEAPRSKKGGESSAPKVRLGIMNTKVRKSLATKANAFYLVKPVTVPLTFANFGADGEYKDTYQEVFAVKTDNTADYSDTLSNLANLAQDPMTKALLGRVAGTKEDPTYGFGLATITNEAEFNKVVKEVFVESTIERDEKGDPKVYSGNEIQILAKVRGTSGKYSAVKNKLTSKAESVETVTENGQEVVKTSTHPFNMETDPMYKKLTDFASKHNIAVPYTEILGCLSVSKSTQAKIDEKETQRSLIIFQEQAKATNMEDVYKDFI